MLFMLNVADFLILCFKYFLIVLWFYIYFVLIIIVIDVIFVYGYVGKERRKESGRGVTYNLDVVLLDSTDRRNAKEKRSLQQMGSDLYREM